jgi:hydrogenase nickel incorporation protein HypA/HybF
VHELAIAESIVAIAERHAEGRRVTSVELKVGHLRQVVPSALTFAFELLTEGTVLAGAELIVEEVPAAGECRVCGARSELPAFPFTCAVCGSADLELTAGEELVVQAVEVESLQPVTTNGGTSNG